MVELTPENKKAPWYIAGLHFECVQCGRCCSGPAAGYVWVGRKEIKLISDFLKETVGQVRQKYLRRIGLRTSIVEEPNTRDCIFLKKINDQRICMIYPVRPNQCRTWPFWPSNLTDADAWNRAVQKCRGINRGRVHSFKEIEKIRKNKKWWKNLDQQQLLKRVAKIYNWLDSEIRKSGSLAGQCDTCGKCCDFESFDHRLFVTTPELIYLAVTLGDGSIKPMPASRCPYNIGGKCQVYEHRFAGCRIFCCKADAHFQSRLSESAVAKFKSTCMEFQIPYRYSDLATALNGSVG